MRLAQGRDAVERDGNWKTVAEKETLALKLKPRWILVDRLKSNVRAKEPSNFQFGPPGSCVLSGSAHEIGPGGQASTTQLLITPFRLCSIAHWHCSFILSGDEWSCWTFTFWCYLPSWSHWEGSSFYWRKLGCMWQLRPLSPQIYIFLSCQVPELSHVYFTSLPGVDTCWVSAPHRVRDCLSQIPPSRADGPVCPSPLYLTGIFTGWLWENH